MGWEASMLEDLLDDYKCNDCGSSNEVCKCEYE